MPWDVMDGIITHVTSLSFAFCSAFIIGNIRRASNFFARRPLGAPPPGDRGTDCILPPHTPFLLPSSSHSFSFSSFVVHLILPKTGGGCGGSGVCDSLWCWKEEMNKSNVADRVVVQFLSGPRPAMKDT